MITSSKWGWDSWVWPSVIRRGLFPVSPCLRRTHTYIHTQPRLLHSDSYSESISGSLTFPNRRSHWHWEGVNVCLVHTLTCTRTVYALRFPPGICTNAHTYTPGEAEQGEASWPVAWQEPSRWTLWVRRISNSEQMIRLVSKPQSSWR